MEQLTNGLLGTIVSHQDLEAVNPPVDLNQLNSLRQELPIFLNNAATSESTGAKSLVRDLYIKIHHGLIDKNPELLSDSDSKNDFTKVLLQDVKRGFECEAASEQYAGGHEGLKSGVRLRLSRIMKKGWAKSQKVFLLKTTEKSMDHVTQYGNSAPPLFGEVQPQSGIFAVSSKHDRPLVTGLLWYYGLQNPTPQSETRMIPNGAANSDAQQAQLSPTGGRFQEKAEVSQGSGSDCMAGIKSGLGHVRSRIKQVFRRCKRVDAFHSLDD
ncbi:uncharacterized protein RAG0_04798 [Rhynchosporium agropyri]|uniref:Uncharacterized protein n=1 Tax=Rhynchosporium agropyri TaxID=914238 RepID=A0A1E1KAA6_9HELO|nr:uncharacterized protein RAG0_04798 [Rhynchosporium agropyri]